MTDDLTLDGETDQRIDAAGELDAQHITKDNENDVDGDLFVDGDSIAFDSVDNEEGSLTIENAFVARGGDVTARDDVTLEGDASLVGEDTQRIDARTGTLTIHRNVYKGTVEPETSGDLVLDAGEEIRFVHAGPQMVSADGNVTMMTTAPDPADDGEEFSTIVKPTGSLTIESTAGDVTIESKVTLAGEKLEIPNGDIFVAADYYVMHDPTGNLDILAKAGAVTVTDLNANGTINVDSPSITLTGRPRGGDAFDAKGVLTTDVGMDVNANKVVFSSGPKFSDGSTHYTVGTPSGDNVSDNILASRVIKRKLLPDGGGFETFGDLANNDIVPTGPTGGPIDTAAPPPLLIDPDEDDVPDLVDVAGGTEGPVRATDVILFLQCVKLEGDTTPLPDDCPAEYEGVAEVTKQGTAPVSTVGAPAQPDTRAGQQVTTVRPLGSPDRPASSPQVNALRIYRQLKSEPVQPVIAEAVESFRNETGSQDVSGKEFRRFVDGSPSHAQAAVYLSEMQDLLAALGDAGMAPAQFLKAARKVLEEMSPDNLPAQQLGEAVRADGQAGIPVLWPQAEIADAGRDAPRS
ncbi:MAG: hypothetical protein JRG76_10205 [Deltaproteobacteria bacterium]|nr:hypothetical protein [Deltaproteobacteria bacterium]